MRLLILVINLLCFAPAFGQSKNLVERVFEGVSKDKNAMVAKSEILNQATEKISIQLIQEVIGESKYSRNRNLIENKIIKNSGRYIPFSKAGDLKLEDDQYKMSVVLRVNMDDLQALLLENGLFYETDGTPAVISSVRWVDQVNNKNYLWWRDGDDAVQAHILKNERLFEIAVRNSLLRNNFYFFQPLRSKVYEFLPSKFRSMDRIKLDDWQSLSSRVNAQIVLDGEIILRKSAERTEAYQIEFKISAIQVQNGRSVGEVSRRFETESGGFEVVIDKKLKEVLEPISNDIANQIFEAWQRGSIGAVLYKLSVRGRMGLSQQESLKEIFKSKLREIKNIRERLISADEILYEVDSSSTPKEMAAKLPELDLGMADKNVSGPALKLVLQSAGDSELIYKVIEVRR